MNMSPPTVYMPIESLLDFEKARDSLASLDGFDLEINCVGLASEETGERQNSILLFKNNIKFNWFKTAHRVPSLGYTISHKANNNYNDDIIVTGDTGRGLFNDRYFNTLFQTSWNMLIIECTYLNLDVSKKAIETEHLCLKDIIDNLSLFENIEMIHLVHFSSRYSLNELMNTLYSNLPTDIHQKIYPDVAYLKLPKFAPRYKKWNLIQWSSFLSLNIEKQDELPIVKKIKS